MFYKRFVHIQHGRTDVLVLYDEVARAALIQAWSGYNQRDADDGVVVSGGFSAQIVVHEHLAVIGYEDEVAVSPFCRPVPIALGCGRSVRRGG